MDVNTGQVSFIEYDTSTPIPKSLQEAALPYAKSGTHVDLKANTPLALWAAQKRRNKRKAQKQSRKANRNG